jgi:aspartate/methionine/tyrosine aminotransferase
VKRPPPFLLEDFHANYEHVPGLLNLATSDAKYWTFRQLAARLPEVRALLCRMDTGYPDAARLVAALQRFSPRVSRSTVIATAGAGEAIFLALAAVGFDNRRKLRVAVPRPAFGAFEGVARTLGHHVLYYDYLPNRGWSLDETGLLKCAETCDAVCVNSPHNPTGAVISQRLLLRVAKTLRRRGKYLIADDAFLSPEDPASKLSLGPKALAIGTLSKLFGLPGLRLGWLILPQSLAHAVKTLQQYTTLSPNSFAASLGAVLISHLRYLNRSDHLAENRNLLQAWAKRNQDLISLGPCQGGTTTVLEVKTRKSETPVFQRLLANKVLLAPGTCFGLQQPRPWFRIGYGRETNNLTRALAIIRSVLATRET